MSGKKFRYFLKADANTYYAVVGGKVVTTTTPTPLQHDPMEWRETDISWQRNEKYHGVFFSFIIPMSFVKDGAKILRHIFYSQEGSESRCILLIEKQDHTDLTYKFYYSGDVDFSEKIDYEHSFQVEILDHNLFALLKANENTPYEIPIEGDGLTAYMDGLRLKNNSLLTLANDPLATNTWHQFMPVIAVQYSESDIQVDVIPQPVQQALGTINLTANFPFFKATIAGTVTIDYDITVLVGNSAGSNLAAHTYQWVITHRTAAGVNTGTAIYSNANFTSYVGNNHKAGTFSVAMQPGDTLIFFAGLNPFNGSAGSDTFLIDQTYSYSTLNVSYDLQLPQSFAAAYRYKQFFEKMSGKVSGGLYTGHSDFLSTPSLKTFDNKPYNTLVTSGDSLRGLGHPKIDTYLINLPALYPAIKSTFEELHNDASDRWMTGIGIVNDQLRLEPLPFFYDKTTTILEIEDDVTDFSFDFGSDMMANVVKVGAPNQDYDSLNGKDEFNNTHTYGLPIIRKPGPWNMVTPYRADMYGIEFIRANLANKKTTDAKSDNDTFVIEVEASPVSKTIPFQGTTLTAFAYPLARLQNAAGNSVTGLIAGNKAFNLALSPKRNFLRNGAAIRVVTHQQDNKTITFQTTDKNAEMASNLGSGNIVEKAPVPVSSLPAPLHLPGYFKFRTKVPDDFAATVNANPFGLIKFPVRLKGKRHILAGFIYHVSAKDATDEACSWTLLPSPETDQSIFIR